MEYVVDVEPEATSTHFLPTNHQSEGRQKYREQYQPLYIAILKNDWNSAEKVINQYPSVLSDYISEGNETALHIAALSKDFSFVKKLVAKLSRQDMEIQNGQGNTALCFAAVDGNIRIAKLMIEKNDKLPNIYGPNGVKPIEMAASLGQKEMVEYLYPLSQVKNWSTQEQATLLTTCISSGLYDAAFRMVQDDSTLIAARDGNGETALHVLAHLPLSSDGECGLHNGLWRRIINSCQFILALCMAFHCGEVQSIVGPSYRFMKNKKGETPHDIFKETHKGLMKDGEKWMKNTASSCLVVATLIATVVFTAAFTVPGGVDNTVGVPVLLNEPFFKVFAISEGIGMFSSSTSILMLLSILTSRYREKDFLHSLPLMLIVAITTLFLSIAAMVVAFCTTLFLSFEDGSALLPILLGVFSCIPIMSFIIKFPLLVDIICSRYESQFLFRSNNRLFQRKSQNMYWGSSEAKN